MKRFALAAALALGLIATSHAGQASNDATTHFQAIASGDVQVLMRGYKDNAQFQWLGGPLDGNYAGVAPIRGIWEKFTKSQGALKLTVDKLEESANINGSTVTANVQFEGKAPIKVRYVLVYRDNMIVSETWQIDPKLVVAGAAPQAAALAPAKSATY
ncbi:nuclear transport factor 2 family protein [Polaromonas sp.]|jgi:glucan biosynthesis protein|uniref:nuclear transport factor 2 family protein n=1 Tax=Polaromonas sp. TaxID=1869339 RepID=UPI001D524185|nr:nuclear transport factor 2 family protein [Polaromonas sp.]MBT9475449.1 nuclear transport factor 2 family protein [Polaromonas sp.]